MNWEYEVFADGVSQIRFENGRVLIDFMSLQPGSGGKPLPEVVLTINLPAAGFLQTFGTVNKLGKKLLEAGMLNQREYIDL